MHACATNGSFASSSGKKKIPLGWVFFFFFFLGINEKRERERDGCFKGYDGIFILWEINFIQIKINKISSSFHHLV